ncbi:MAG: sulfotransferase [Actinomycetota bacterium]
MSASDTPGRLPDFIIVGAMKAGTTSLSAWLRAHPQVFVPQEKELHFFDTLWSRGVDWYRSLFAGAPEGALLGEATPNYMVIEHWVERMASVVPDARLIAVLRHPVDRAWSHYVHSVTRGDEVRPFAEAVGDERAGDPSDWRSKGMLARGRYLEQLQVLTRFYDRARIHVGFFDDLKAEPTSFFASVCRFLGVDDGVTPSVVGEKFDPFDTDPAIVKRSRDPGAAGRPPLTRRLKRGAAKVLTPAGRRRTGASTDTVMSPEVRSELVEYFRPYNEELATWLARDLSSWNR